MKKLLSFLAFNILYISVFAQSSIFQDSKGESGFKLFGNAITVNSKAESINASLDILKRERGKNIFNRWGMNLELAANEGLVNVKGEKGLLVDGSVGIYRGFKKTSPAAEAGSAWTFERFVALNLGIDRNKFFNANLPKNDMFFNKSDFAWKIELGQFGYTGNLLYGIAGSFKRQSNIGDLQSKTIRLLRYELDSDSTLIYSEKKAFDEGEFLSDHYVFNLNGDAACLLNRLAATAGSNIPTLFAAFHFRFQKVDKSSGQFNPGIGFYLGKPDSPRSLIGGFNIQFLDIFNGEDNATDAWQRATINIVAGFKLGN